MTTRTFDIPSISCGHCKAAIEGEVARVGGVQSVVVDIDGRTAVVVGDADEAALRAAIDEAGYDVAGVR